MRTRILVCDDHPITRLGIRLMLGSAPSVEIVGEAHDGREAVHMAATLKPDLVLLDIAMPRLDGIAAARLMLEQDPHLKIIAFSMHDDPLCVRLMLEAGVRGYVLKQCAPSEVSEALEAVLAGKIYLSSNVRHWPGPVALAPANIRNQEAEMN